MEKLRVSRQNLSTNLLSQGKVIHQQVLTKRIIPHVSCGNDVGFNEGWIEKFKTTLLSRLVTDVCCANIPSKPNPLMKLSMILKIIRY